MTGNQWLSRRYSFCFQELGDFLPGLRLDIEMWNAIIRADCGSCRFRQFQTVIYFVFALASRPVLSRHVIGHKAGIALFAETNTPFCAAQHSEDGGPRAEDAYGNIIMAGVKTLKQQAQRSPVVDAEQGLWTSPDVRVVGNQLRDIRVMLEYLRAPRRCQHVDGCLWIGPFQGANHDSGKHKVTDQVKANDQDMAWIHTFRPHARIAFAQSAQPQTAADHTQSYVDAGHQHALAGPDTVFAQSAARIWWQGIAVFIESMLLFKCVRHASYLANPVI